MKIVFTTFVTDDKWLERFARPLANSSHYFHPNIPFKIFTGSELEALRPKDYFLKTACLKAIIGAKLAEEYEQVVFFDADSIITGHLSEILEKDYELAGVRNIADNGCIHGVLPQYTKDFQIPGLCSCEQYLNSGLVSSRTANFWTEWVQMNKSMANDLQDQDQGTFNRIFYSSNYKALMLDPPESPYYYGISSAGDTTMTWSSWKNIYIKDNGLYMYSPLGTIKQVKVLHLTGNQELGDGIAKSPPPYKKFLDSMFTQDTVSFLRKITGE